MPIGRSRSGSPAAIRSAHVLAGPEPKEESDNFRNDSAPAQFSGDQRREFLECHSLITRSTYHPLKRTFECTGRNGHLFVDPVRRGVPSRGCAKGVWVTHSAPHT